MSKTSLNKGTLEGFDGSMSSISSRDAPSAEALHPRLQIDRSALAALRNGEPLVDDLGPPHGSYQKNNQQDHSTYMTVQRPMSKNSYHESVPDLHAYDGDEAPAPPNFSGRSASNNSIRTAHRMGENRRAVFVTSSVPTTPDSQEGSSIEESMLSAETEASSINVLPPLQTKGLSADEAGHLDPLLEEDDPRSFDLVAAPAEQTTGVYGLEKRAEQLLSSTHLETIFANPKELVKFTGFLNTYRPQSIPILVFYLDALKALRAIAYANAISHSLEYIPGYDFTEQAPHVTHNNALREKADRAFQVLVTEDLPAYIVHVWIQVVSVSISKRVTGTLAPHLREASEGLAEVFCLSDPSRPDNPIVFASQEFHRTTQYGMSYAIGRNCRFLQGPRTSPHSVRRLATACKNAKEHSEVFVNYRRDGSPFMNLLMVAPLFDSQGTLRYYIGAQVDVSGLLKDCSDLASLANIVARDEDPELAAEEDAHSRKDELQSLSEMLNVGELETVRAHGGRMHREQVEDSDHESIASHRPRLLLKDSNPEAFDQMPRPDPRINADNAAGLNGKLEGVYQNYLLVRPAPSLRILFTSPSLRVPGILQSPFLSRVGGSPRVRSDLMQALTEGRGVTAKIRWLTKVDSEGEGEGRTRWIHATPLYSHTGAVGVWMILLVDDQESAGSGEGRRRFRQAPPVASNIGGKEYDARHMKERRETERTKMDRLIPRPVEAGRAMTPEVTGNWQGNGPVLSSRYRTGQHVANLDKSRPQSSSSGKGTAASELSFQLR